MSYITEIFERANLQHLREFLMNGTEACYLETDNYEVRLNKAYKSFKKVLYNAIPDMDEESEILSEFCNALSISENVYMEIGIQVGIILREECARPDRVH